MRVGGAQLVGPALPEMVRALLALRIPLVEVGRHVRELDLDAVVSDDMCRRDM